MDKIKKIGFLVLVVIATMAVVNRAKNSIPAVAKIVGA